jgi:hypothetical protein
MLGVSPWFFPSVECLFVVFCRRVEMGYNEEAEGAVRGDGVGKECWSKNEMNNKPGYWLSDIVDPVI